MEIAKCDSLSQQKSWLILIATKAGPEGDQDAKPESAGKKPEKPAKVSRGKAKGKATPKPKVSKASAKSKVSEKKKAKEEGKEYHQTDYGKAKKSFSEKCLDEHLFVKKYLIISQILL